MDTQAARIEVDKALIEKLGGCAKLAELLGYEKDGGIQRVQNWTTRGIPAAVKVERPDLFMADRLAAPKQPAPRRSRAKAEA